jgi:hypothetical protein
VSDASASGKLPEVHHAKNYVQWLVYMLSTEFLPHLKAIAQTRQKKLSVRSAVRDASEQFLRDTKETTWKEPPECRAAAVAASAPPVPAMVPEASVPACPNPHPELLIASRLVLEGQRGKAARPRATERASCIFSALLGFQKRGIGAHPRPGQRQPPLWHNQLRRLTTIR